MKEYNVHYTVNFCEEYDSMVVEAEDEEDAKEQVKKHIRMIHWHPDIDDVDFDVDIYDEGDEY